MGGVLHKWERLLSHRAIDALVSALELQVLTQSLDLAVLDALGGAEPNESTYARAYRKAGWREDRQRQIWLIAGAGRALDELARAPAIGVGLRMARLPARLAGVTVLHQFLERGHAAFSRMQSAQELLRAIEQRETTIMQRLFAGTAHPFRFDSVASAARQS